MSSCSHLDQLARLQPPRLSQFVHREECTQCFDSQDDSQGIEVCLTCFNGGCLDPERRHALLHVSKLGHPFTLNVKRNLKPSAKRNEDEEPPAKMTKLSISEEREEDKYDYQTIVKCWQCDSSDGAEIREATEIPQIQALVQGVMQTMSSARQSEVEAWEEEILTCEHTLTLEQLATGPIPASGLAHCSSCDLKENLWLCLTCGSLGCGRHQLGGVGGNGHGLAHYEATHHPVSVKLGTITPEGGADVYCYQCNDSKLDPELATHLSTFGINVQTQTKTEKSITELQIEHNLKYDFSLTDDDGKAFEPVCGPGLTGLMNLGNSCYMASVLQTIFSLPSFQQRYGSLAQNHAAACTQPLPADCLECQMHKVADGLLSGRYSRPANYVASPGVDAMAPVFQAGIKPTGFKALIGKGHEEFSTMRQQDSEEFFTYLITALRRDGHKHKDGAEADATSVFAYGMEQRLQCNDCKKVRYRVDNMDVVSVSVPTVEKGKDADGKTLYEEVQLWKCLELLLGIDALKYTCPSCQKSVHALRQSKFASFPDVLVVQAKKFQLVDWVPAKLDIPVLLPVGDELHFTDNQLGHGLQADEIALPENETSPAALPHFNEAAMAQLETMGFPVIRCQKALLATGNSDLEAAMEWLFGHMEDPDIDEPIQPASSSASDFEPSPEQVSVLSDMGFTPAQARKSLRETEGNVERAVEWLFNHLDDTGEDSTPVTATPSEPVIGGSKTVPVIYKLKAFISHKGPSVHSGHYVAHIKVGDQWVLFNDEKVVKADDESVKDLKKLAYLYIFERV
ncbi:ubiquitinyl hydrolase [Guyanagaster necrorhizus]|uniref:Ubiquitin carboxyl-terminal hydrolase n=1 Tax=Guyanagaster necrorhizus TaxID=856835 RepID=A0A9P7VIW6_9AGAR|nr:ubiquitinyl hydrolase [Guyanagaster necrorhizus MCA 3950]KAG7441398.1 ubiquitinyl hydrolase [Guyanagaster necrorhizus MCA 3950]